MDVIFGVSPRQYDALVKERDDLQTEHNQDLGTILRLKNELAAAQAVGRIANYATEVYTAAANSGEIMISAEVDAQQIVTQRLMDQATGEQTNQLLTAKEREYRRNFGPTQLTELRTILDTTFAADGTYTAIDQKVRDDFATTVGDELKVAKTAEIEAILNAEDVRAAEVARIRAQMTNDGTFAKMLKDRQAELEPDWKAEAVAAAKEEIKASLLAGKTDFIDKTKKDWRGSTQGQRFEEQKRKALEQQWNKEGLAEVATELQDEVLLQVLQQRRDREGAAVIRQEQYASLLEDFGRGGIDTTKLPAGTPLTVQFGAVVPKVTEVSDGYGGRKKKSEPQLLCDRELKLTALGEGKFVVDGDSLADADNTYIRNDSVRPGTVLHLGRELLETGKPALHPHIQNGVPLAFDDDRSDSRMSSSIMPVANVLVDGVSARDDYKSVEYSTKKAK